MVAVFTVLGLGLRLYQLARPGYLLGAPAYDDGVDFGSAIRLTQGYVPYRDFAFVQPPGITLLMAPVALLAKTIGTDQGFAIARVLTALAGAAGVTLAGLLVRHRGALVTAAVCAIVALHSDAIFASSTVFLEPWLGLFCLLGAVALFEGDELTENRRRLLWGGVALGFSGAVKVWAVLPVLVILLAMLARRRPVLPYLAGVLAGFCVPVLTFVVLAPRAFFDSVVVAQLSRVDVFRTPVAFRLDSMFGLSRLPIGAHQGIPVAVASAVLITVCVLWAWLGQHGAPPALESFALATAVVILIAFMLPPDYYVHYASFFTPFLALAAALPVARLVAVRPAHPRRAVVPAVLGVALLALTVNQVSQEANLHIPDPRGAAGRRIPAGACVLTDNASSTIAANRFVSTVPGCTPMLDSIGLDYWLAKGRNGLTGAGEVPAVRSAWLAAFSHAQFVWLFCGPPRARSCDPYTNRRIPWTAPILGYFTSHFVRLPGASLFIYRRRAGV